MIKNIENINSYDIKTEINKSHEWFSRCSVSSSINGETCSKLLYNMVYNYTNNEDIIEKECPCSFALSDMMGLCASNKITVPIIEIYQIFTEKNMRENGIASDLIKTVVAQNPNAIIFAVAGASKLEYPDEPAEDEFYTILENLKPFYEKTGFIDINRVIGGYERKCTYLYVGNDNIGVAKLALEMLKNKLDKRENTNMDIEVTLNR